MMPCLVITFLCRKDLLLLPSLGLFFIKTLAATEGQNVCLLVFAWAQCVVEWFYLVLLPVGRIYICRWEEYTFTVYSCVVIRAFIGMQTLTLR